MASKARKDGERIVGQLLGDGFLEQLEQDVANDEFGSFFADHSIESCFGTIWARPGLGQRERSIATLGMVIAVRDPSSIKSHVRAGLINGLTRDEIEEVINQAIPYLGYPTAGVAIRAAREVFAESDDS